MLIYTSNISKQHNLISRFFRAISTLSRSTSDMSTLFACMKEKHFNLGHPNDNLLISSIERKQPEYRFIPATYSSLLQDKTLSIELSIEPRYDVLSILILTNKN